MALYRRITMKTFHLNISEQQERIFDKFKDGTGLSNRDLAEILIIESLKDKKYLEKLYEKEKRKRQKEKPIMRRGIRKRLRIRGKI
jgi:vacuolar-type H+-ATPase subunit C/Vma6